MKGFSLLEVLIAAVVLAVIGVAAMTALRQSTRAMHLTAQHTSAMLLAQKVVDELSQGLLDNPYADADLEELSGVRRPIRERGHPFFAGLEDSAAPWGRLDAADLAVDVTDPDLFTAYGPLSLTWVVVPHADAPAASLELSVSLDWPDGPGLNRDEEHRLGFVRPQAAPPVGSMLPEDPAEVDRALARVFGPAVDPGLTRDLAPLVLPLRRVIDDLNEPALPVPDPLVAARIAETRGAWIVQAVLSVAEPARLIATGGLADPRVAVPVRALARRAARLREDLAYQVGLAIDGFARAAAGLARTRPYRRLALERRVVELEKLRWMLGDATGDPFLTAWLGYMERAYRGRDRAVAAWLEREVKLARTKVALTAANPVIAQRVERIGAGIAALAALEGALGR